MSRKMFVFGLAASMVSFAGPLAWADGPATQPDNPATAPSAVQPAEQPDNLRDVYEALLGGLYQGEPDDIAKMMVAGADAHGKLAMNDHIKLARAIKDLRVACVERFKSADAADHILAPWDPTFLIMRVQGMQQATNGDQGMLALRSEKVMLVREDGQWKIDMSAYVRNPAHPFAPMHAKMPRQAIMAEQMAKEIRAGRFAKVEDAAAAFQQRGKEEQLMKIRVPQSAAEPSTAPSPTTAP